MRSVWQRNKASSFWHSSPNSDHARRFLTEPSTNFTKNLLSLKKADIYLVVGIITGHTTLVIAYKHRIRLRDDPLCDRCNLGDENAEHFACWCPAWKTTRKVALDKSPIQLQEVAEQDLNNLCSFPRRTGRVAGASPPSATRLLGPQHTETALPHSAATLAGELQQIGRNS